MKKVLFACVALMFASAVIGGCRAEGEIDTATSVTAPR